MSDFAQLYERVQQLEAGLPPENVEVPYVSGGAAVGETLHCTMGVWNCMGAGTYAYAWSGGGIATDASYVVGEADAGQTVTCVVTATNANGSVAAPPSNGVLIATAVTQAQKTRVEMAKKEAAAAKAAAEAAKKEAEAARTAAPTPLAPTPPPPAAHRETREHR